ncbi:RrF2 family transcriptional regulator [Sphingomonas sanxanigenens]|uniref:Rrf2 family transcriptional regulator n=1 Tax=Sphingomonas sanxanigenens DSM 19645 = NX02 TaxID=1123269 RepID=W0AHR7_9SPHN|nr:Rrf2 family transcriptional regulator [Sphingomonas sanxanigenens]AHE55843.1 hypothetical protein NX02_21010 [Sphingomonas sanxanigenens DSM 19645 = NX02]
MLSQKTRYALRSLLYLAERNDGLPIQLTEIAATQQVPRKYLELIMLDLKKAGMVKSRRGPGGGYVLARPANDITFGEVIRTLDGPLALVPCASLTGYRRCEDCHDEATCAIRHVMAMVRQDTAKVLDGTSLAQAAVLEGALEAA